MIYDITVKAGLLGYILGLFLAYAVEGESDSLNTAVILLCFLHLFTTTRVANND